MQNNSNTQSTISPNSNTPSSSLDTSLTTHESEPMKPRDQMIHDLYYKQNLPQKEIAKRLGISKSTVGRVFKKHGWTGRKGRRYSRRKDCPHPKEEDNIVRTQNKEKSDLLCSDGSVKRSKWNELDFEEVFRLYFDEKLSMQTIAERYGYKSEYPISRIFHEMGWKSRASVEIGPTEVYRLYFEEGLTQKEIARKLGFKSKQPIHRIFKEQGWTSAHRWRFLDADRIYDLYYKEKRSLREIAEKLRAKSTYQIICVFEAHGWSRRPFKSRVKVELDPEVVHRLYFDEGINMIDMAKRYGYATCGPISRIFKDQGWSVRRPDVVEGVDFEEVRRLYFDEELTLAEIGRKLGVTYYTLKKILALEGWSTRRHRTEEERKEAQKDAWLRHRQKVEDLRDEIFGLKCTVCSDDREVIHRKDGEKHGPYVLWSITGLESLNPDEWAPLCKPCHLDVHALMRVKVFEWKDIVSLLRKASGRPS